MKIILETPRLILRQFTMDDAALILELNSDQEVLRYLHEPKLETVDHAKKILETIILPQYQINLGRWAIELKKDGKFIGWCGLKYRKELDEIDLGYRFRKDSWGQGFGYESALHTLEFGFQNLSLDRIVGRAHVDNIASLKILEKIGMQFIRKEIVDECPVKTYVSLNPAPPSSK